MTEKQMNVRNQARRPVSIRGNSGDHCHIDAQQSVQMPVTELKNNAKLNKLLQSGVLTLESPDARKKSQANKKSSESAQRKSRSKNTTAKARKTKRS